MVKNSSNIIYSKQALEFVTVVTEWCNLVDIAENFSKIEFIHKLHKLSAFVYQKASILPDLEQIYGENEKFVTELDWTIINNKLEEKLGSNNEFVQITETDSYNSENVSELNLAEIISDIYQSLKDFITLYEIGNEENMNDALYEIKEEFGRYWGIRIISVISSLHKLIFSEQELIDEENINKKEQNTDKSDNWVSEKWKK